MTLREIIEQLELCKFECEGGYLENNIAYQELLQRTQFIEKLIEDGLDLDDHFLISYVWKGE